MVILFGVLIMPREIPGVLVMLMLVMDYMLVDIMDTQILISSHTVLNVSWEPHNTLVTKLLAVEVHRHVLLEYFLTRTFVIVLNIYALKGS